MARAHAVCLLLACVAAASLPQFVRSDDWSTVDATLEASIAAKVFPGCVAGVLDKSGVRYLKAHGSFTYGQATPVTRDNPRTTLATRYDMASLTKVTATTSAIATFYQRGELDLDMRVSDDYLLGAGYAANGKETIVVRNLMLHNAGYPPDPVPNYWDPKFGCPATSQFHPPLTLSCNERIYASLLNQTLINPVGEKYVYSDLSMVTAAFIVGTLAKKLGYTTEADLLPVCRGAEPLGVGTSATCYYEAYVRVHVFEALNMSNSGFLPPEMYWGEIAPTWFDNTYRHLIVQGEVSDGNSYALGGVAGHAGLFSTGPDMLKLLHRLAFPTETGDGFLNATTVKTFTTAYNLTQSSRALGWDTNSYTMNTYRGCGNFSTLTFTHLGYTGTEVCVDPTRGVATVLLDNRPFPDKTGGLGPPIQDARRGFNNAVLAVVDGKAHA